MKVVKAGKRLNAEMLGRNFVETVRIERVTLEQCGDGRKPCMYFEGHDRSLVLNATNIDTLVGLFGTDEGDDWVGRAIQLYTEMTSYQGRPKLGIRVRGAHHTELPAPAAPQPADPTRRALGQAQVPVRGREPGEDDGPVQASQIRW